MNLPEALNNLIKPELIVLIPVLYYVGHCLKRWETFKDTMIPVTIGVVGIFLAAIYVLGVSGITNPQEFFNALFAAVTQGLLCAAGAVYLHQIKKQEEKGK